LYLFAKKKTKVWDKKHFFPKYLKEATTLERKTIIVNIMATEQPHFASSKKKT
jgi:hypothetical protein